MESPKIEKGPKDSTFTRWWEQNKDGYNSDRRDRYHSDPEYRETVLARNAKYRKRVRKTRVKEAITRVYKGVTVAVHTISDSAHQVGRSTQVLRLWERHGVIPKPIFEGRNRMYTTEQIAVMKKVAAIMDMYRLDAPALKAALADLRPEMKARWKQVASS